MRLIRFLVGILLLRRLPCGCFWSWLIRLAVWAGIAAVAIELLKRFRGGAQPGQATVVPSGWTAPPPREPEPAMSADSAGTTVRAAATAAAPVTGRPVDVEPGREPAHLIVEVRSAPTEDTSVVEEVQLPEPELAPRWIRGDGSPDCPLDFPVKAKAASMIYHVPGSSRYAITTPDVCFASAGDAEAAGYRAPKR